MFKERKKALSLLKGCKDLRSLSLQWQIKSSDVGYSYTKDWLGVPIIQRSDDIVEMADLIYKIKPTCIIETGVARGGSMVFYASMLSLLDIADGVDPRCSPRRVIGVDVDIRAENFLALKEHPLYFNINLVEGSSIDPGIVSRVRSMVKPDDIVLVVLDSNHSHRHVFSELEAYSSLVSLDSYCVVFDTVIEDVPKGFYQNRNWDVGNNPKTAVHEWLRENPHFCIDDDIDNKLLISVAPNGYLRRTY